MYRKFFGMRQRPFAATPQLGAYYPWSGAEEAGATLRYCITQGRGIGVLSGMPGTGKTMLCHRIATAIDGAYTTAMITNTHLGSPKALLQAIMYDLALPFRGMEEQELRLTLTDFLLGRYASGGRTVIIIDEAQNLTPPVLEEIRLLGNLEGETDKLVQVLLVGQPPLIDTLRQPGLDALRQRIGARATLTPMNEEETAGYIRHQLRWAGVEPDKLITEEAAMAVYEATGGIPRLINRLCEHSLLLAYVSEVRQIDQEIVEQAQAELNREDDQGEGQALVLAGHETECAAVEQVKMPAVGQTGQPVSASGPADTSGLVVTAGTAAGSKRESAASELAPDVVSTTVDADTGERYESEELIVDQYAVMDDRRQRRGGLAQQPPSAEVGQQERTGRTELADAPAVAADSLVPDAEDDGGDEVAAAEGADEQAQQMDDDQRLFLQPNERAAVFEVGAGVTGPGGPAVQPPVAAEPGHSEPAPGLAQGQVSATPHTGKPSALRVRLDAGQPLPGPGAYRRLFTRVRKH